MTKQDQIKNLLNAIETEDEVIEVIRELSLYLLEAHDANGDKFSVKTADALAEALKIAIKNKGQ